jgi:hypothetical protein
MVPVHAAHGSHFCDDAMIARRISRLLDDAPVVRRSLLSRKEQLAWILAGMTAVTLLAGPGFPAAYAVTEAAVRLLQ